VGLKINIPEHDRIQFRHMVEGFIVYGLGDLLAQIILGKASIIRTIGIGFIGGTVYALEVPLWFRMIENTFCHASDKIRACMMFKQPDNNDCCYLDYKGRTLMAMSYFNPIWIARHMFFLSLLNALSAGIAVISPFHEFLHLIPVATKSFVICIPITVVGNYIVQNRISMKYRLIGSAVLSAVCVFWFAIAKVLFGG
jgi:hypothetical protein